MFVQTTMGMCKCDIRCIYGLMNPIALTGDIGK